MSQWFPRIILIVPTQIYAPPMYQWILVKTIFNFGQTVEYLSIIFLCVINIWHKLCLKLLHISNFVTKLLVNLHNTLSKYVQKMLLYYHVISIEGYFYENTCIPITEYYDVTHTSGFTEGWPVQTSLSLYFNVTHLKK